VKHSAGVYCTRPYDHFGTSYVSLWQLHTEWGRFYDKSYKPVIQPDCSGLRGKVHRRNLKMLYIFLNFGHSTLYQSCSTTNISDETTHTGQCMQLRTLCGLGCFMTSKTVESASVRVLQGFWPKSLNTRQGGVKGRASWCGAKVHNCITAQYVGHISYWDSLVKILGAQ